MGNVSSLPISVYNTSLISEDKLITYNTNDEHKCLSEALYFEARGESKEGIIAVGNVILNRVKDPKYPNTICKVINQKNQFSYKWDNNSDIPSNKNIYKRIQLVAFDILHGARIIPDNILYYHNIKIKPNWTKCLKYCKIIGNHIFYSN